MDHEFWWSRTLVIDVWSLMSDSVQGLDWIVYSYCLAILSIKSVLEDNNKVVENYLSFPESLISPLLDAWISNYGWMKLHICCCPGYVCKFDLCLNIYRKVVQIRK